MTTVAILLLLLAPLSAQTAASRILAAVEQGSTYQANLRRLTDHVGGRRSGSPAMRQAVAWAVDAFKKAGVDSVTTQKFPLPSTWDEGATRLEVLGPNGFRLRATAIAWTPALPPPGMEAALLDVGQGADADFAKAGSAAKHAILLVHNPLLQTWEDLFSEYMRVPGILARAKAAGAAAVLWTSTRERMLLYRHQSSLDGRIAGPPQAIVAREDALRLTRRLAGGETLRVRLALPSAIGGPVPEENVIAEIRGREQPEEFVILGAHLDSWDLGSGALDNGCNAAMVVEVARIIKAVGPPRRSVRFVLYSGEEQGMLGSKAHAESLGKEIDNLVAVVIHDTGSGRMTGYSLGGRPEVEPALREILRPIYGADHHTPDAFVGTDNLDYLLRGVPTLVAGQVEANYIVNYHAQSDTFDKVDLDEMHRITAIAAVTVYGIADRAERFGRRQSPAEVQKFLEQTGLGEQLRLFGMTGRVPRN